MGNKAHNKLIDEFNKTFGQNIHYAENNIKSLGIKEWIKNEYELEKLPIIIALCLSVFSFGTILGYFI